MLFDRTGLPAISIVGVYNCAHGFWIKM